MCCKPIPAESLRVANLSQQIALAMQTYPLVRSKLIPGDKFVTHKPVPIETGRIHARGRAGLEAGQCQRQSKARGRAVPEAWQSQRRARIRGRAVLEAGQRQRQCKARARQGLRQQCQRQGSNRGRAEPEQGSARGRSEPEAGQSLRQSRARGKAVLEAVQG